MKTLAAVSCAALVSIFTAAPVLASEDLAKQKACMACHSIDKKIVGPSFKDIAQKYQTDKDAEKRMAEKILKGGSGVWGQIPMPPNSVTPAEAASLAKWSLAVK